MLANSNTTDHEHATRLELGGAIHLRSESLFRDWSRAHGSPHSPLFWDISAISRLFELSRTSDVAVGIATSGICGAYFCERFGMKAAVIEAHSERLQGQDRVALPTEFEVKGKRVLVIDNDAVTGETMTLVIDLMAQLGASNVEGFLFARSPKCDFNQLWDWESRMHGLGHTIHLPGRIDRISLKTISSLLDCQFSSRFEFS